MTGKDFEKDFEKLSEEIIKSPKIGNILALEFLRLYKKDEEQILIYSQIIISFFLNQKPKKAISLYIDIYTKYKRHLYSNVFIKLNLKFLQYLAVTDYLKTFAFVLSKFISYNYPLNSSQQLEKGNAEIIYYHNTEQYDKALYVFNKFRKNRYRKFPNKFYPLAINIVRIHLKKKNFKEVDKFLFKILNKKILPKSLHLIYDLIVVDYYMVTEQFLKSIQLIDSVIIERSTNKYWSHKITRLKITCLLNLKEIELAFEDFKLYYITHEKRNKQTKIDFSNIKTRSQKVQIMEEFVYSEKLNKDLAESIDLIDREFLEKIKKAL